MGQPLISDAQLRAIHETMLRLREMEQDPLKRRGKDRRLYERQPIALLAATLLQLHTDDVLIADGPQPFAEATLAIAHEQTFHPGHQPTVIRSTTGTGAAMLAAGYALAQSRSTQPGDRAPVTTALLQHDAPIDEAMRLAGESSLPLILILRDPPGAARRKLISPTNVEIINIDAEDAIACCRVMQESLLRTRNRWGAVVLRGLTLPGSLDPVAAITGHLHRRGIAVPSSPQ